VSDGNDSPQRYDVLARALLEARPADVKNNAETRETWERCVESVELALRDNDPSFDWHAFRAACGTGIGTGDRKYAVRFLVLVAALIGLPIVWEWHRHAVTEARAIGRSDTWALICEKHPRLAELLLNYDDMNPVVDGPGLRCTDLERHFNQYP
jgi:hypothetical protein